MININSAVEKIDSLVWGAPLIILILFIGVWFTFRLGFVQIRYLIRSFKYMVKDEEGSSGEVSSFAALCTTLSATIGTGNIVGVATAISLGGPGALFWMCVAAFVGMATKYAEGLLSVKYREIDNQGRVLGGAFYYIEKGMGKKFTWLGKLFAFFGAIVGLLGIGTFAQINSISSSIENLVDPNHYNSVSIFGLEFTYTVLFSAIIVTILVALILVGGIKRISRVSELVVPFMAILYFICCLIVIFSNYNSLLPAIASIFTNAFTGTAAIGGFAGATIKNAIQKGVSRGIFSNEAGLGSSTMATAAAKTKWPARQGLVSMVSVFIDTLVVCNLTGIAILSCGVWKSSNLEGSAITAEAFKSGFYFAPQLGQTLLTFCLVCFAFTTIIGWNYYGEQCVSYLFNKNQLIVKVYRWLYVFAVFFGAFMNVSLVWNISDIFNGLMAFPNLIALFALSRVVISESKEYFSYIKNEKQKLL